MLYGLGKLVGRTSEKLADSLVELLRVFHSDGMTGTVKDQEFAVRRQSADALDAGTHAGGCVLVAPNEKERLFDLGSYIKQ